MAKKMKVKLLKSDSGKKGGHFTHNVLAFWLFLGNIYYHTKKNFFYYLGNKVVGGLVKKKCDIIWTLICRRDIKSLNTLFISPICVPILYGVCEKGDKKYFIFTLNPECQAL